MLEKDGLVKLVEECGELIQIASKKMACMETDEHWDNAGSLSERLENEIADVRAAINIVEETLNLNTVRILDRAIMKTNLFLQWLKEDRYA